MGLDLRAHLALLVDEQRASEEAAQSLRRAGLVVRLADMMAERVFERWRLDAPGKLGGAEDVLAYRDRIAAKSPALAVLGLLSAGREGAPALVRDMVPIADLDQGRLLFADWMITTYNEHKAPALVVAWPDGRREQLHPLLAEAVAFWQSEFEAQGL